MSCPVALVCRQLYGDTLMALPLFRLPYHVMVCSCYCLNAILRSRPKSALERLSCVTIRARHDCNDFEGDINGCTFSLDDEYGSRQEFKDRALEECEKFSWHVELDPPRRPSFHEERIDEPDLTERRMTRSMPARQRSSGRVHPVSTVRYQTARQRSSGRIHPVSTFSESTIFPTIAVRIGVGGVIA